MDGELLCDEALTKPERLREWLAEASIDSIEDGRASSRALRPQPAMS